MIVNGLVLVAGLSTRMHDFKPLMKIGEKTMIEIVIEKMLKAKVDNIVVVLGFQGDKIKKILEERFGKTGKLRFAYNVYYATTQMLDSVKEGLKKMPKCEYFFVVPGDMPAISVQTYKTLYKHLDNDKKVVFPIYEGRRKHPPLVSWKCKEDILNFNGQGLRELWKQYEDDILEIPIDDKGCIIDVDNQMDFRQVTKYMYKYG